MNNSTSKFFSLNGHDFVKGLIMAVLSAIVSAIIAVINKGGFSDIEWGKSVLVPAAVAALSYISKNLLTNSDDQFLKKEN